MMEVDASNKKRKRESAEEVPECSSKVRRLDQPKSVGLQMTMHTDIGDKDVNEDKIRCTTIKNWKCIGVRSALLCVLCDGHGGPEAATYVTLTILEKVFAELKSLDPLDIRIAMHTVFSELQDEMRKTQLGTWPKNPKTGTPSTAGTTVTIVLILGNLLVIAHVGDSPVIAGWKRGEGHNVLLHVKRLTKTHSAKDVDEIQSVESRGGRVGTSGSLKRVCRADIDEARGMIKWTPFLSVTRALGDFWSYSKKTKTYAVSSNPDVSIHTITEDVYIVICSDGVTDVLSDVEIIKEFQKHDRSHSNKGHSQEACRVVSGESKCNIAAQIVRAAKESYKEKRRRQDNISAIAIKCVVL